MGQKKECMIEHIPTKKTYSVIGSKEEFITVEEIDFPGNVGSAHLVTKSLWKVLQCDQNCLKKCFMQKTDKT